MVMNIADSKGLGASKYNNSSSETKKTSAESNEINYSKDNLEVSQVLGNDSFVKSTEDDIKNSTYKPIKKKLTPEEIEALKDEQDKSEKELIKKFISDTIKNQNNLLGKSSNDNNGLPQSSKDLLIKIFGSLENAYPPIATTPEGAQAAITEGGPYSVNAVADRIMSMATAIAGDDKDKLQKMRDAVEEGFSQAGLIFKDATTSDLPQICKDTYTEIMSRFDKLQNKTHVESQNN
ncbi:hypothetical protein [Clostridium sp. C2-6-12]|uniref:hypothetical protein n=1 Tax=Clostridium sp. C2-6-12 TaxID=2698832 RepID=UPI001FAE48BB|nr:hypothetical protein [Clostridium sp. C2-6-12]